MRIALAQLNSVQGDFQSTVAAMLATSRRAETYGADLVIFPETILTGAYPVGPSVSGAYQMALLDAIEEFAAHTDLPCVVPAFINDGTYAYYEAFLCQDGKAGPLRLAGAQHTLAQDAAPNQSAARILLGNVSVRLWLGGEDLLPDDPADDVVVMCSSRPFSTDDPRAQPATSVGIAAMGKLAQDLGSWLAGVSGVGGYDEMVFAGGSFAIEPGGHVAAHAVSFEEDLITFDAEPVVARGEGQEGPVEVGPIRVSLPERSDGPGERAARPSGRRGFGTMVGMSLDQIEEEDLLFDLETEMDDYVLQALELSLRDRVTGAGLTDVVLSLDSGACSAAVLALAVHVLGAQHVHALVATGAGVDSTAAELAAQQAQSVGVEVRRADVAAAALALATGGDNADEQPVARRMRETAALRGVILERMSEELGALPLSCMSKTHAALGIPTTCAAPTGAFAPLADVFDTDAETIIDLLQEDGLASPVLNEPLQLADETLADPAFEYIPDHVVRDVLKMHLGGDEKPADGWDIVQFNGYPREWVDAVLRCVARTEAGRRQDPPGPVISNSSLIDRGMPAVFGWVDPVEPNGYHSPDIVQNLARLLGVSEGSLEASADAGTNEQVAGRLDDMVGSISHKDQVIGAIGDVVFGLSVGRFPDVEESKGTPGFSMFSRN